MHFLSKFYQKYHFFTLHIEMNYVTSVTFHLKKFVSTLLNNISRLIVQCTDCRLQVHFIIFIMISLCMLLYILKVSIQYTD